MNQHVPPSKEVAFSPTSTASHDHTHHHLALEAARLRGAAPPLLQTYPALGQRNDCYEQEAERVADNVMHMTEPLQQRQVELEEENCRETRKTCGHADVSPLRSDPLAGQGGKPLPQSVRDFFEPRFGYSFSDVRVHNNAWAATTAQALHAQAYTANTDIVFGARRYAPETFQGRRLIAHELTHVVQQTRALPASNACIGKQCGNASGTLSPTTRSGTGASSPEEIQTCQEMSETEMISRRPLENCECIACLKTDRPMIQREWALEPPNPEAEGRTLSEQELQDAKDYNNRVIGSSSTGVLEAMRDVLGVPPTPATVDDDFVNAVVSWQAAQGLTQDGKLGPRTAAPLFREVGAEGVGQGAVLTGPTYTPHGTIPTTVAGGRKNANFSFEVEFEDDPAQQFFPSCGELRQYIRWDAAAAASFGASGVPHSGFPTGSAAGTWIEDRDASNKRYGHRSGRFSDPQSFDQYLDTTGARNQAFGETYEGNDGPGGSTSLAGVWEFAIQCVDVCNNDAPIGGNDYLRIVW